MKRSLVVLALVSLFGASSVFASGFRCVGEGGYRVKVYNQVDPKLGTRTPAHLIISKAGEGTLLVANAEDIEKVNHPSYVEYTVKETGELPAIEASLHVSFAEGNETLESGEEVEATLILTDMTHAKEYYDMTCTRYLKGSAE
jgi:hypothetical protein